MGKNAVSNRGSSKTEEAIEIIGWKDLLKMREVKIPEGWKNAYQIAEELGVASSTAQHLLTRARALGKIKAVKIKGSWYYAP